MTERKGAAELSAYDMARADGYVDAQAVLMGRAVRTGGAHPGLDMVKGYMLRTEKWAENADLSCQCQGTKGIDKPCSDPTCYLREPAGPVCTVDGTQVAELALLIKPVAFLVTVEHGTHELGRVYLQKGKFAVGVDTQRIGSIGLKSVEYDTAKGLHVHLDHGYEMFIPASHCQATWRLGE